MNVDEEKMVGNDLKSLCENLDTDNAAERLNGGSTGDVSFNNQTKLSYSLPRWKLLQLSYCLPLYSRINMNRFLEKKMHR